MAILNDSYLSIPILLSCLGLFAICYPIYYLFIHPLHRYPGPFLAKLTDLWRYTGACSGEMHKTTIQLHEKYGPVVRTGPTTISIADPSYIPKIYGIGQGFHKGAFYNAFAQRVQGRPGLNLFTSQNAELHAALKKPVASAYAMSTLTEFEPFVDDCIVKFMNRLSEEFVSDKGKERTPCDLGAWLQYYAFDVIAVLTLNQPLGFLDQGKDVNNMIKGLEVKMDQDAPASHMPWLDWALKKNPLVNYLAKDSSQFSAFAASLVQKRSTHLETCSEKGLDPGPRTFIDRFLEAQRANPNLIDDRQVVVYTTSNIVAGSDTTAISLRAVVYRLIRHPDVLQKLLTELERANVSFPVTWKQSQDIPYLEAVVQEALRLHPAVGFGLERVVPEKGLQMDDGTVIPGGNQVCMNAWVVHLDPAFGLNPKEFRPERWLRGKNENDVDFKARLGAMKRAYLVFGHGSRTCTGKNISLLEIYKLIPTLLMKFKLELVGGVDKEWKTKNAWFVRQWDMDCYVEER